MSRNLDVDPPEPSDAFDPEGSNEGGEDDSSSKSQGGVGLTISAPQRRPQCPSGQFFDQRSGKCRTTIDQTSRN